MSAEEKQELLPKKETEKIGDPIERPTVPKVDYSKKTFYDYLGLKNDASEETIKSTYAELSKKYNPITNPDEISRYQDILYSGETLTNPVLKKFYDEYGDVSVLLFNILQIYFPLKQIEKPSKYIYGALFGASGVCACLFITVMAFFSRFIGSYSANWIYPMLATIVLCLGYLIYIAFRTKYDITASEKCEGDKKECKDIAKKSNCISALKTILLIIFQLTIACYFNNNQKGLILALIPYIVFEAVCLCKDTVKFVKAAEAIKNGKEVDCPVLKKDTYIKFLTGKANAKDKDGKKGSASTYLCYLLFYIYKTDVIRIVQNILISASALIGPSNYTLFYLPTFIMIVANIGQGYLQQGIGYVRGTVEYTNEILKNIVYVLIGIDTCVYLQSLNYHTIAITSQSFPFLVELALCVGFFLGILPFILIIEFKIKHDETDVPY
jgi:hypothetical protein